MKLNSVANLSSSIVSKLRYVEWLFLAIHLILEISYDSYNLEFMLAFYGIFSVLSLIFPVHRSLIWRQTYVILAILLIIWANFVNVSLDLLLYLYLTKSFFLINSRRTYLVATIAGISWVSSECFSELRELNRIIDFVPPFGFGSYNLSTILIFSCGLYLAGSLFVILLCSVINSEYESRRKAEALAEQVEILAADLERTRIARDIHDSLGHTLTNLDIQLAVAQKLRDLDPQQAILAIDTAKILSSQCIEDVSHALKTMRDADFDLIRALNNLLEQLESDRVKINWEINLPPLPVTTNHQIYCIVKEGLINIQKHARATYISFESTFSEQEIILQLKDNGIGFDTTALISGFGLRGMKERVQLLGGQLKINSSPKQGTQILAIIPR